jgi:hypothetical protein
VVANDNVNYLQQTGSAIVASDGTATVQLGPSGSGEYWAPNIIRVSTNLTPQSVQNANASYCAVYHGSPAAVTPAAFLDDTYLGSGDSSSVVAGTIVQYGETLTASWQLAQPGDTAIATVYGRTADTLQDLQSVLSLIPGAKFSGNTGNAMQWAYNDFTVSGPVAINSTTNPLNPQMLFQTPFNLNCELSCVRYSVTSSASATPRAFGILVTVFDGTQNVPLLETYQPVALQASSSTFQYTFTPGVTSYSGGNSPAAYAGIELPPKIIMPPLSTVSLLRSSAQTGDTYSNLSILYRQYRTLDQVGYT